MFDLFLLSEAQMRRFEAYFPLSHGNARVDHRVVISGIIVVIKNGLQWRDAPREYGPHNTLYHRFVRWSQIVVIINIFAESARKEVKPSRIMIDATHLKAHRTAAMLQKRGHSPPYWADQRRVEPQTSNSLRWAWTSVDHAPEQRADERLQRGALMLPSDPKARELLGDKGYDADWFRAALADRGIQPCIPSKFNGKVQIPYTRSLSRQRYKIENMFGKLRDWRRIHTRYDRCAHTFMSALCISASVIFWMLSISHEPKRNIDNQRLPENGSLC